MPILKETRSLPAGPLYASYWDARGHVHGWRPKGTKDWLLLYTESGQCLARYQGGEFNAGAGDVILFQAGHAAGLRTARSAGKMEARLGPLGAPDRGA